MKKNIMIITDKKINDDIISLLNEEFNIFLADKNDMFDILDKNNISCILDYVEDINIITEIKKHQVSEFVPIIVVRDKINLKNIKSYVNAGAYDFYELIPNNKVLNLRINEAIKVLSHPRSLVDRPTFDRLCDIYNEETFKKEATKIISEITNYDKHYYVVIFDINKFTMINYFFGVKYGENVLRYISKILSSENEEFDICYGRLSKDRFAFLLAGNDNDLKTIVSNIKNEIKSYNEEYDIELTFGVYEIKDFNITIDQMLDYATLAAKKIKGSIGPAYLKYDDQMRDDLALEQNYVSSFEQALKNHEFIIYLQPKYDIILNKIIGAEALVRWGKNDRIISPGEFIPIFERNGLIDKLDRYVWEETVKYIRWRMDNRLPIFGISVNVSRIFLSMNSFIDDIISLVKKYDVPSCLLELEITETIFSNVSLIKDTVQKLRDAGFKVLMDDFGSGYSGLNVLKDVDFDAIKIDLKFFSRNDKKSQDIIKSVLDIAHAIDIPAIAEGVESLEYIELLKKYGCNWAQGYFYSKPLPIEEFNKLCERDCTSYVEIQSTRYVNIHHINLAINDFITQTKDYQNVKDEYIDRLLNRFLKELNVDVVYTNIASSDGSKCIFLNCAYSENKYNLKGLELPITVEQYASQCMLYDEDGLSEKPGIPLKGRDYKSILYYGLTRGTSTDGTIGVLDFHKKRKWTSEEKKALKLLGRALNIVISRARSNAIKNENIKKEVELKKAYNDIKIANSEMSNFISLVTSSLFGVPIRVIKYNFNRCEGKLYKNIDNKPFVVSDNNIFDKLCDFFNSAIDKPDIDFKNEMLNMPSGKSIRYVIKSYQSIENNDKDSSIHTTSIRVQTLIENDEKILFAFLVDNSKYYEATQVRLVEANRMKDLLINIFTNDFVALTGLNVRTRQIYRFAFKDGAITGYTLNTEWEKLIKQEFAFIVEDDIREKMFKDLDYINILKMKLNDPIIYRHRSMYETKDTPRYFQTECKVIETDDKSKWLIVYTTDISKSVQTYNRLNDKIKKLEEQVSHDSLTDIFNRTGLESNLENIKKIFKKNNNNYLLFLDANYFKEINDNFGHLEGDNALKSIGDALNNICSEYNAFAYRSGGDEFVLLISIKKNTSIDDIINRINDFVKNSSDKYDLTLTVGVAKGDYNKLENLNMDYINELLDIADIDLRKKKKDNKIER